MKWQNKVPSAPGWYWYRNMEGRYDHEPIVLNIRDYAGDLAVDNCIIKGSRYGRGEWAGPIPEPGNEQDVIDMALCEVSRVRLRPNVLYKFTVMEGCESCAKADVY